MGRNAGLAALTTLVVVAFTQAVCFVLWGDMPEGYPLSIVLTGVAIPAATCFPISLFLLDQRGKLAESLGQLRAAHILLEYRSARDPMTGLLHRQAFMDRLPERRREAAAGAFIMIDIDHFKTINDGFGHSAGDRALALVARAIEAATANDDLLARFGGEEFCVFSPVARLEEGRVVAERIREAIEAISFVPAGAPQRLTASLGLAHGDRSQRCNLLLENADAALYEAKRDGRNRVATHRPVLLDRQARG